MAEWQIELLTDDHERGAFSCGKSSLDAFIRTQAGQYARKDVGRTYVAIRPGAKAVIGYYTLSASAIEFTSPPSALSKKLPKHPVPTVLLGRLAVDTSARGTGLGRDLLADALKRTARIAGEIGVFAIHAHALDDDAKAFYAHFGFLELAEQERHMFLPVATIRKQVSG